MKNFDIVAYTARFSDHATLCPRIVTPQNQKVERYIWGLSTQLQGNVITANPLTFDCPKRLAQTLVDHGVCQGFITTIAEQLKESGKKRSSGSNERGNHRKSPQRGNKQWQFVLLLFPLLFVLLSLLLYLSLDQP